MADMSVSPANPNVLSASSAISVVTHRKRKASIRSFTNRSAEINLFPFEPPNLRWTFSFSEHRCAYAHMGGAEADGGFEVGTHAHAETFEAVRARDFREQGEMGGGGFFRA